MVAALRSPADTAQPVGNIEEEVLAAVAVHSIVAAGPAVVGTLVAEAEQAAAAAGIHSKPVPLEQEEVQKQYTKSVEPSGVFAVVVAVAALEPESAQGKAPMPSSRLSLLAQTAQEMMIWA